MTTKGVIIYQSSINVKKHPNKEIHAAIEYALKNQWQLVEAGSSSHAWARLKCPYNDSECRCGQFCLQSIWSTPKNPQNHAKQIRRIVDNCLYSPHNPDF